MLSKYVEQHPDYFLSEIANYFSVTLQTIFYALKRLKITRKKTTRYKERDEKKREAFMKDLNNIPFDRRIYLDATGIHQFLFREPGRSLRGKKVFGAVSGNRFVRQNIISVLSKGQFLSPMYFEGTCNTGLFDIWLKEVLTPQLTPGSVLTLDNAGFHKLAESRKIVESAGCKLMFLPPYF